MDNLFLKIMAMFDETSLVKNSKVNKYTIDTAYSSDCGYETAIWKDNNSMIIVERYKNKEDSIIGHKKWCKFCKTNPKCAYSVQLDEYCEF